MVFYFYSAVYFYVILCYIIQRILDLKKIQKKKMQYKRYLFLKVYGSITGIELANCSFEVILTVKLNLLAGT